MVEGGVVKAADKTELTECWKVTWKTPYIMRFAFSAGIGGLLFCDDTAVFMEASSHAPKISGIESAHFGSNSTCSAYLTAPDAPRCSCMTCLKADCAFCAIQPAKPLMRWRGC